MSELTDIPICVFGDSNTWGAWDTEKGGWVNRLKLYYDLKASSSFYVTVYNLGIDGDDTSLLLKRFDAECKARAPKIVIFDIGSNDTYTDSKGKANVSLKQFEKNIARLANKAKKFTHKIAFVGFPPINESKTRPVAWDKNG